MRINAVVSDLLEDVRRDHCPCAGWDKEKAKSGAAERGSSEQGDAESVLPPDTLNTLAIFAVNARLKDNASPAASDQPEAVSTVPPNQSACPDCSSSPTASVPL